MNLLVKLAWRNILRNKRRLLLTLLAISFAAFTTIAMRGIQIGTYDVNIRNVVKLYSGYLQVQRPGYQNNPSLRLNFDLDSSLIRQINSIGEIKAYSPRVLSEGLVSFKDNSFGAAIFGLVPEKEMKVTNLVSRINEGNFFSNDTSNEIVIGYKLLENLKAKIGDQIVLLTQGYDGSLGNMKFTITGTFKLGSSTMDAMTVIIGLSKAQELLSLGGRVHTIALNLSSIDDIDKVKPVLVSKLQSKQLNVLSWDEVMPDFKQSIELDSISGMLYMFMLIIIVAFGILNTVLMSVVERFNEFGITLSIGMPQKNLVYLVFIETFFVAALGLILGNIIGWGINYYIMLNPIQLGSDFGKMYEEFGFLPIIEASLDPAIFINTSITIFIISALACFYPAYKVYRLEPMKGIRYT